MRIFLVDSIIIIITKFSSKKKNKNAGNFTGLGV